MEEDRWLQELIALRNGSRAVKNNMLSEEACQEQAVLPPVLRWNIASDDL